MRVSRRVTLFGLLTALLVWSPLVMAQQSVALFQPGKLRALIFSGRNNHDWRASTPYLKQLLEKTGKFDVRIVEEPEGATRATLAAYDVLVLDYVGPRWGPGTEEAVEEFVRSGKGLVVVHGASYAFTGLEVLGDRHRRTGIVEPPWNAYVKMIGGYWTDGSPKTGHGQYHSFTVKIVDRTHLITEGMKESFLATDELYHNMRMSPDALILARAFDSPAMGGTGREEPVLWVVNYGKGRVFHTTLGHDLAAMHESGFVTTFLRGTEWAASNRVTLPTDIPPFPRSDPPLRLLVVTGGHDYPTSFYSLFNGTDDLVWDHVGSSQEVFQKDIRSTYDVVVFYDMSPDLGEPQRKNLRDFLESGKGAVVIHHAIANYPEWDWWSRELVGGKYLLKPQGDRPASTYLHDQEMFLEQAMDHPVLRGLGRMHLWDETYKGMWISPRVTVLLKTDHPSSDGPVAWVSPYEKSRVVCIQPGHDQTAHRHPAYQKLVRNAIRWAAGRLEDSKR